MNHKLTDCISDLAFNKFTLVLFCLIVTFSGCTPKKYSDPLSPEDALKSFTLNDEFEIEIFAAEPFVLDPVDMIFDDEGNVYVVEMPDYPSAIKEGKASGSIRLLRDTNNDGRIDKSIVFADSLSEATSIMVWNGGLLVTAAPNIFYMKDTSGDFRADIKEVLFSGFFKQNSEAQITCLRFGPDNWIYANNRGQDGLIKFTRKTGAEPLSVRGADFRFRLDLDKFEPETGPGQFGETIDQWGHRFFTENTIHLQQAIIPWRYLHRHAFLPSTNAVANISDHDPIMYQETAPPWWRAERTNQRNKKYREEKLNRVEYAEDHFTGGSGGTIYLGDAFPKEYYGNIFTGDVAGNLVHRDVLTLSNDSAVFTASRGTRDKTNEFLSSKDPWFRPANFVVGPDGFLYVIDMYRQHIETPMSIPEELMRDMDFFRGSDMGRIYRIRPKSRMKKQDLPNLKRLSASQLADLLPSSNQWLAIQAQRLLLEKHDSTVIEKITQMVVNNKEAGGRLRALFVLEGLNALNEPLIKHALSDADPNIRENALILAEKFPALMPSIIKATADTIARVAFQATLSLGEFKSKATVNALAWVLQKYAGDKWFRMAVLSSEPGSSKEMIDVLVNMKFFDQNKDQSHLFLRDISYVIGARNNFNEELGLLKIAAKPNFTKDQKFQISIIEGIKNGLKKAKTPPSVNADWKQTLNNIRNTGVQDVQKAVAGLDSIMTK